MQHPTLGHECAALLALPAIQLVMGGGSFTGPMAAADEQAVFACYR